MKPTLIDETTTPDGAPLTLTREHGHYVISVSGAHLMSSEMYGSEQAMATYAQRDLGEHPNPRVLVGGLGMGFTLRAALDVFGEGAQVTVAELLPAVIRYNRDVFPDLAGRPLEDSRVHLHEGDVRTLFRKRQWDVVLMDVDNGPDAFTTPSNGSLYGTKGIARMAHSLEPGGILVVWSAFPSPSFEDAVAQTGLSCRSEMVRGRWPTGKGPRHVLTIASRPKG